MLATSASLVGSTDRQLEQELAKLVSRLTTLSVGDLPAAAAAGTLQPDVVVLDLQERAELPAELKVLKDNHPATPVVIVASSLDPQLILQAMRAGVNECVTSPVTPKELEAAVARVVVRRPAATSGQVYAFLGTKGGVGATTMAVNVACALAKVAPSGTLLIDLHLAYGDAAEFFGAQPRFSVVDALENTHRLDDAVFGGLVSRTKAGVDLLPSSDRPVTNAVDPNRLRALLEFAAQRYRYVVLDVPRSNVSALDGLEAVSKIVLVANQEFASVKNAGRIGAMLRQRYGRARVAVALTRYNTFAEIGQEDVERTLGGPIRHVLPSDYRLALEAVNRGRPLILDNHSKLANSFEDVANDLAELVKERPAPERSGGLFGRLTGRRG